MIWPYMNVVLSIVLGTIIAYKLLVFDEPLLFLQRLGLGGAGGAVILSIAVILDSGHKYITPFSNWYQSLWRLSWILFIGTGLFRDIRHRRAECRHEEIALARMSPERRAEALRRTGRQ